MVYFPPVGAGSYQGLEALGIQGEAAGQVEQMIKALVAGNDINNPGTSAGAGFPLRVESLEATLKNLTFRNEHVRLWRSIPKLAAFNTIEEHNTFLSYGQQQRGFIAENQLPPTSDSTYERNTATIKYMGVTREVSHVMSMVAPAHGSVIANEVAAGTMDLLRMVEDGLFFADSSLSPTQFDGFQKLIVDGAPATNIIDLRGATISEYLLSDACSTVLDAPNYGNATNFHANPQVISSLVKSFFPKGRYETMGAPVVNGAIGARVNKFVGPGGDVSLEPNTFLPMQVSPPNEPVGAPADRPGTPTISTPATTPVNASSQFLAEDAGSYHYTVVAYNDSGNSAPVTVAAATAVAAGDDFRFGVTPSGSGGNVAYYELYRSRKGGPVGSQSRVQRIVNSNAAGEQIMVDLNATLPFTSTAFLFQQNTESMSWKQLAPFLKIPLATLGPAIRWMQLVYGTPVIYAPGRNVVFLNVGVAPDTVGIPA